MSLQPRLIDGVLYVPARAEGENGVIGDGMLPLLPGALGYADWLEQLPPEDLQAAGWDESAHPRWPAGDDRGGEFAPKDSVTEAVLGRQGHGGYKVSKAPNLRAWMEEYPFWEAKPDWMQDVLEEWPNISSMAADRLRDWLNRTDVQDALNRRGMGKQRQEAKWVLRDLDEGKVTVAPGEPEPVATLPQQRYTRSLLDSLRIGSGAVAPVALDAARTVDATMLFPKVPGELKVEIKGVPGGRSRQAALWREGWSRKPSKITVAAASGINPVSSTVHELGHYLDSLVGQDQWAGRGFASDLQIQEWRDEQRRLTQEATTGADPAVRAAAVRNAQALAKKIEDNRPPSVWNDYSSDQSNGTLRPVVEAIKHTTMYHGLEQYAGRGGRLSFEYGGRTFAPGKSHVKYLMQPTEMVARSFEQYIAAKNPKSKLASTSRHVFSEGFFPPEYPGYMQGQDLNDVNAVWEKVLADRGLLKKPGFEAGPRNRAQAVQRRLAASAE